MLVAVEPAVVPNAAVLTLVLFKERQVLRPSRCQVLLKTPIHSCNVGLKSRDLLRPVSSHNRLCFLGYVHSFGIVPLLAPSLEGLSVRVQLILLLFKDDIK